jgi:hypothetical protein
MGRGRQFTDGAEPGEALMGQHSSLDVDPGGENHLQKL